MRADSPVCPPCGPGRRHARAQGVSHMPNVSAHSARPRRVSRDAESSLLRHWSDVLPLHADEPPPRHAYRPPPRVTPEIASVLRDLVSWASDLAVLLTNGCPDD